MKFRIEVDCTPEEARAFLGLPDVRPLQESMMKELEERTRKAMAAMDPEQLMKIWAPAGFEGWEQMQKFFWNQFGATLRQNVERK